MIRIRQARECDRSHWITLRSELWPEDAASHHAEVESTLSGSLPDPCVVLLAEVEGETLGFAEVRVRPLAEGCESRGVGYLEGWYVRPSAQGSGIGRALIVAAEDWARSHGCTEFASDTETTNEGSFSAHLACGFELVETVHLFRKSL